MKIAAYSVLRNARILNYPFYDAFVQCLPNVDEFYIFVEKNCDDDTQELARRLADEISKFRIVEISVEWDRAEAIAEAQTLGTRYLKNLGYRFALLNQADEFFSPHLRPLLMAATILKKNIGFRIVHTWRLEWVVCIPVYCRYFSTALDSTGDGANNTFKMDWIAPTHVMHLGSVFSPEVKYAHHSRLYGGLEAQAAIAVNADNLSRVESEFSKITGVQRFMRNHQRLRSQEREIAQYAHEKRSAYPFDLALERLVRTAKK